jgi:hypothetical protein
LSQQVGGPDLHRLSDLLAVVVIGERSPYSLFQPIEEVLSAEAPASAQRLAKFLVFLAG